MARARLPLSRRHVLAAGAAGLASIPFASLATASLPTSRPLRFLAVYTPMGQMTEWLPIGSGRDYVLSDQASSFAPVRDKILFIRGMRTALTINDGRDGGHQEGHYASFCGTQAGDDGNATGISVDQEIGNRLDGRTPFHSLALGVLPSGLNASFLSFTGPGRPLPPIGNAMSVYNSLFANFGLGERELALARMRKRSVLDLWTGELGDLSRRVGPARAHIMDAHLQQIRTLERQLDEVPSVTCVPPANPGVADSFYQDTANYPAIGRQMMDLIIAAFACDLTRSCSLMWHRTASTIVHSWVGATQEHHALTHDTNPAIADEQLRPVYRWYSEQMAYLCQRLDEIPEGDGTMLDHTVIYWGQELGDHRSHNGYDMRILLAGGGAAGLDLGRYIELTRRPVNDLLAEMVDAVTGEPTSTFDEPLLETVGGLSEIRV